MIEFIGKMKIVNNIFYKILLSKLQENNFNEGIILKLVTSNKLDLNVCDEHGKSLIFGLARKKKIEAIDFLLKQNVNINIEDNYGKTALSEVVDNSFMLSFLISRGANINYINSSNRTLIQDMAFEGNLKPFKLLYSKKADLKHKDKYRKNVLFDAIEGENIEIVKDIVNSFSIDELNSVDIDGKSALFYAVLKENSSISKLLIDYGIDVNIVDNDGQNTLFNTVLLGAENLEILKLLVKKGINLEQQDNQGKSIVDEIIDVLKMCKHDVHKELIGKYRLVSSSRDYLKFTDELFRQSVKSFRYDKHKMPIFHKFILKNDLQDIKLLSNLGINFNIIDSKGQTVLFSLVFKGLDSLETMKFLYRDGVNINQVDNKENTIIDYLVEIILVQQNEKKPKSYEFESIKSNKNYFELLKNILALKPKINEPKSNGQTVVFDIIPYNSDKLLNLFIDNKIDLNTKDTRGQTPLFVLVNNIIESKSRYKRNLFLNKLSYFLTLKLNCNSLNAKGQTILHKAVIADDYDLVEKIVNSKRVELDIQDRSGKTAIFYTAWSNNLKISAILMQANCSINEIDNLGYNTLEYAIILGQQKIAEFLILKGASQQNDVKREAEAINFILDNEDKMEKLLENNYSNAKMKQRVASIIRTLKESRNL